MWDGTRWADDDRGDVRKLAHDTAERHGIGSTTKIDHMLREAQPYMEHRHLAFDDDPLVLNTESGCVYLGN